MLKQKKKFNCSIRKHIKETNKFDNDYVWLLWEIIFYYTTKNTPQSKTIHSLYELYKLNFTKGKKNKKIVFLKFAFLLLLDCVPKVNYNTPIFYKTILRWKATLNINELYKTINYNKKHIGYKNSENKQIINNNDKEFTILNTKNKITKLNNPDINKRFGEYLRKKQFCPSENVIKKKYNDYAKQINLYNKQAYFKNKILKQKQLKLKKQRKTNSIIKNVEQLLNNQTHQKNKSKLFKPIKKAKSLFKTKSKLKYDNTLSNLYKKL